MVARCTSRSDTARPRIHCSNRASRSSFIADPSRHTLPAIASWRDGFETSPFPRGPRADLRFRESTDSIDVAASASSGHPDQGLQRHAAAGEPRLLRSRPSAGAGIRTSSSTSLHAAHRRTHDDLAKPGRERSPGSRSLAKSVQALNNASWTASAASASELRMRVLARRATATWGSANRSKGVVLPTSRLPNESRRLQGDFPGRLPCLSVCAGLSSNSISFRTAGQAAEPGSVLNSAGDRCSEAE